MVNSIRRAPRAPVSLSEQARVQVMRLSQNSVGFGSDTLHVRAFECIGDLKGITTIYAHGKPGGVIGLSRGKTEAKLFSKSISATELLAQLKQLGLPQQPLRLFICNAADRGPEGEPATAEILSRGLGVDVIAGGGDVNPFAVDPGARGGIFLFTPEGEKQSLDTRLFPR